MNKWRTHDITVFTRLPEVDGAYQVIARNARCYGQLAVHPRNIVDHTIKDKDDPTTWEVEFGHSTKHKRWKITHWPTGLTFSDGHKGYGYKRKANALRVAEQVAQEFDDVLRSLPLTESAEAIVNTLMGHPRFDDLQELKHKLEEKYGIDRSVKD